MRSAPALLLMMHTSFASALVAGTALRFAGACSRPRLPTVRLQPVETEFEVFIRRMQHAAGSVREDVHTSISGDLELGSVVLSLEVDATEAADAVATVQPQNKEPITEPAEASLREVLLPALEAQPGTSKASPAASLDDEYVTLTMSELQDSSSATVALGLVFGYLALGVAVYSQYTSWSVLECLYFVVVTLSSVGFGDLSPQTDVMRLFTCAYILVGVGILGTALGEVVSSLLDTDGSTAGKFIRLLSGAEEKAEDEGEGAVSASLAPTLLTVAATVALGTGAFSYFDASLSPVQALYYSIVTVTTVGYGDFVPQSDASRAFMTVYALFGEIPLTPTLV